MTHRWLPVALACLVLGPAFAAETTTIRLLCTVTLSGQQETHETLVTVTYDDPEQATITVHGTGAPMAGEVTEDSIRGKVDYVFTYKEGDEIVKVETYRNTVYVNRLTGAYEFTFEQVGVKDKLITLGSCKQAPD
jgi:predicted Mrr-cat superfamily restriction endonuclease